jgi:integrase
MSKVHSTPAAPIIKQDTPALQPVTTAPNRKPAKPAKPYPEYPLTAHPAGYWCKKIRGKIHYFGPWADPKAALDKYEAEKDALHAGRRPRAEVQAVTVKDVANTFLNAKQEAVDSGELSQRTWNDYKAATDLLVKEFEKGRAVADLGPADFAKLRAKMAKQWGPHRLGTTIQCIRCVFRFAYESDLIDRPMRYGPGFKRPSKKTMRLHKAKQGAKLFTAEEVRRMIDSAGMPLKAMILLGINCGFGNADCAELPRAAVDLEAGWIDYPRPKTGIARRCALWLVTVQAIKDALAKRPKHKSAEDAGLVFITRYGYGWGKDIADSPVTKETRKLLDGLSINGRRNFYTLRHTFRTVADASKDQPAVDHIMGHETPHMSAVYREGIDDERLRAVADHVHRWLFSAVQ